MNSAAALAPRPSRAPRGFAAADRCRTCDGRGQHLVPAVDVDGEILFDDEGFEVETPTTCEDCEGKGWSRDERTPAQVAADARARREQRAADHLAYVAATGDRTACGGAWCRCPR